MDQVELELVEQRQQRVGAVKGSQQEIVDAARSLRDLLVHLLAVEYVVGFAHYALLGAGLAHGFDDEVLKLAFELLQGRLQNHREVLCVEPAHPQLCDLEALWVVYLVLLEFVRVARCEIVYHHLLALEYVLRVLDPGAAGAYLFGVFEFELLCQLR